MAAVAVPAFPTFSAVSELLITAILLAFLWRAWRHDALHLRWAWGAVAVEAAVFMSYMVKDVLDPRHVHTAAWLKALGAVHGLLALAVFLAIVGYLVVAHRRHRMGYNLVRQAPAWALALAIARVVALGTGEAIYVGTYLL